MSIEIRHARRVKDDELRALRFVDRTSPIPVRARDVAAVVGWTPRTAGPKMASLERRGLVARVVVRPATLRNEARHGWVLTDVGRLAALNGGEPATSQREDW